MKRLFLHLLLLTPCLILAQGTDSPFSEVFDSPDGSLRAVVAEEPGKPVLLAVQDSAGRTLWAKPMGFRAWIRPFWSPDSRTLAVLTDYCGPSGAELKAPSPGMPDYLFVLNARTGDLIASVNGDEVLNLKRQHPDLVGAARNSTISIRGDQLTLTSFFDTRDLTLSGRFQFTPPQ